jgi:flagellar biosynthetic protein FlhB
MAGELPPTPRRREEARRAGQVAHSPLLTGAAALLAGALAAVSMAGPAARRLAELFRRAMAGQIPVENGLSQALSLGSWIVLPIAMAALAGAAAAGAAQTRGLFTLGAFERRAREEAAGFMGWALAAALILFAVLAGRNALAGLPALDGLWPRALLLFAAAGAADFVLRRARLERALAMTRAERRAEQREEEGDPRLKAERRRRQRALAGRSLVDDLARAQVVLAAEGVALALKQEPGGVRVVAAGERLQAQRMVEVARRLGIEVRADDRLASALAELKAGDWVPAQHLPRTLALIPRR